MKEKFSNYVTGLCKYIDKNAIVIAISALTILAYNVVIAGLMLAGNIPVYSWDPNMPFWKKCLWEQCINAPLVAWIISWVLIYSVERKEK